MSVCAVALLTLPTNSGLRANPTRCPKLGPARTDFESRDEHRHAEDDHNSARNAREDEEAESHGEQCRRLEDEAGEDQGSPPEGVGVPDAKAK